MIELAQGNTKSEWGLEHPSTELDTLLFPWCSITARCLKYHLPIMDSSLGKSRTLLRTPQEDAITHSQYNFFPKALALGFDLTKKFPTRVTHGRLKAPNPLQQPFTGICSQFAASLTTSSYTKSSFHTKTHPAVDPLTGAWGMNRAASEQVTVMESQLLAPPSLPTPTQRPVSNKLLGNSAQDSLRSRSGLGTANTLAIIFPSHEPRLQWAGNVAFCL